MMKFIRKIWGKIVYGFASFLSGTFNLLIKFIEFLARIVKSVGLGLLSLLSMGGCFFIFLFSPFLLFRPSTLFIILFLVGFPVLGIKFVSFLKYIRYAMTEYLFDYADNLIHNRKAQFDSFGEYGRKYKRMEEERLRREQQRRQEAQQREWEERFRRWAEDQNSRRGTYGDFGGFGGFGQGAGSQQGYGHGGQTYTNPNVAFKNEYEKSCDILGIPYNSDKYEVKLAFRKKAKQYHPDVNKAADATKRFQEINAAYEFLSDANIDRYKNYFSR